MNLQVHSFFKSMSMNQTANLTLNTIQTLANVSYIVQRQHDIRTKKAQGPAKNTQEQMYQEMA